MTPADFVSKLVQELGFDASKYVFRTGKTWVHIQHPKSDLFDLEVALRRVGLPSLWVRQREPALRITLNRLCVFALAQTSPKAVPVHVVYTPDTDWCALYCDGRKVREDDVISLEDALAHVEGCHVLSVETLYRPLNKGHRFPEKLDLLTGTVDNTPASNDASCDACD